MDVPGGCAAIFGSVSQSYYIFVSDSFNSPMPFLGRFYQYLHIFCCLLYVFLLFIMCISSNSQTEFWAQNFRDVQLIPNFFKISSLALIFQFLEGIIGKKLPNRWILIQK